MKKLIAWLPAFALTVGPCTAYLAWAITRRQWFHVFLALILNYLVWIRGPIFVLSVFHR